MDSFQRFIDLVNITNYEKISKQTILIVGLGGVGGYVLESLVRLGIKNIIIVDYDTIDITNLNRQILALNDNIGQKKVEVAKNRALNINHPITYGTSQTEDVYFECMEARNTAYNLIPDIVNDYMAKINALTGKDYHPFNYYGSPTATNVIVAMGSVCDTIKLVIDNLASNNLGLIEVHLYRPFSKEYLLKVLPKTVQKIAVLDRTKESGSSGEPLYLDIVSSLKNQNITIVGGRYGLSSKNTTPAQIKAVFDMLDSEVKDNFTIGITDDVTNLSLPIQDYNIKLDAKE